MQTRGSFPELSDNTKRGGRMAGKYCAPKVSKGASKGMHVGRKGRMSGNHKQARGSK